jgi:hypothetical protein
MGHLTEGIHARIRSPTSHDGHRGVSHFGEGRFNGFLNARKKIGPMPHGLLALPTTVVPPEIGDADGYFHRASDLKQESGINPGPTERHPASIEGGQIKILSNQITVLDSPGKVTIQSRF